jgi:hypothetical protein
MPLMLVVACCLLQVLRGLDAVNRDCCCCKPTMVDQTSWLVRNANWLQQMASQHFAFSDCSERASECLGEARGFAQEGLGLSSLGMDGFRLLVATVPCRMYLDAPPHLTWLAIAHSSACRQALSQGASVLEVGGLVAEWQRSV